jgi:Carboxypeptidase regulatory-like domain
MFLLFACAGVSLAQNPTAVLTGQVTDSSGATIAGAQVQVRNNDTNISREVQTDDAGRYLISNLNPGPYDLTVEAQGFEKVSVTKLTLAVAQEAHQDVVLTVGVVSQVVNVEANVATVETETSDVGTVVNNEQVVGLPLNQRNFYSLAQLAPGVLQPAQSSNLGWRGGFAVAGSSEGSNTFILNGIDDNDNTVNVPDLRPSIEAIQEFKVIEAVAPAEYGRSSGAHINTVTKSGTNQFHGDAFEFFRNEVFDARNYFNPPPNAKPGTRQNQYGGVIGGPLSVPKVYDGHNKTFFFASYEGMALAQGESALGSVPTAAMQSGDFRSLLALPTPIHVVNPKTGLNFPTPNVIPAPLMTTLGKELAALYPAPTNSTTGPSGPANNYDFSEARTENLKLVGGKVDHIFSDKDSLFLNYNFVNDPSFEPDNAKCNPATIPDFGCYQNERSNVAIIGETHTFNAHVVNDLRLGWTSIYQQYWTQESVLFPNWPALPGAYTGQVYQYPGLPDGLKNVNAGNVTTTVNGFSSLGSAGNPQAHWGDKFSIVDSVSFDHGNHSFKLGIDIQLYFSTEFSITAGRGELVYNSQNAATYSLHSPTSGYSFADLLLGTPYQTIQNPVDPNYHPENKEVFPYFEDSWKARPNLTLNLGLRWEYIGPMTEPRNLLSLFNLSTLQFNVVGQGGLNRGVPQQAIKTNFAPRVGLAWQPFNKDTTVVRAAGGIFFNSPPLGLAVSTTPATERPWRATQTYTSSAAVPLTDTVPYQAADVQQSITGATYSPTQRFQTAYVSEWTLGVQQQINKTMVLSVDYFGTKGTHFISETNANQAVPTTVNGVTSCCTRPLPASGDFGNITVFNTDGGSNYQSLQAKLQQSYRNGLTLLVGYTYGHSIDRGEDPYVSSNSDPGALPENSFNRALEIGSSDFDVTHHIILSPVYELPFGTGKPYLNEGIGSKILGGWQVSTITTFQTGRPFTVTDASSNISGSLNNVDRPNMNGNPNDGPKTVAEWFNISAFSLNPTHTFGNERRNQIRGPGLKQADIALQRGFHINEKLSMQFRAESFNFFNHPNFQNPLGTTTGAFGDTGFGALTAANDPRQLQFSCKILF